MIYNYRDFKFIFNIYKKNELDKFIKYLDSNYSFFYSVLPHNISFVDDNNKDYEYVKNTMIYINNIIKERMDDESIKKLGSQDNILMYLYRDYLFYEYDKNNCFNKFIDGKDSNFILSLIAYIKYDDFNKIKGVVLNSKYSKDKLLDELKNELRVDLFNNILKIYNMTIEYRFNDLYSVIVPLFSEFDKKYEISNIKYDYSFREHGFTNISFDKLSIMFKEFLKDIDPTLDYLDLYNDCIDNNKLIINKNKDIEDVNLSGISDDKIYLDLNGNTHDFNILSHEFAHHISQVGVLDFGDKIDNLIKNDKEADISTLLTEIDAKEAENPKFSYKYYCDGNLSYDNIIDGFRNNYSSDLSLNTINNAMDRIIQSVIVTGCDNLQMVCYIMADYLLSMFDKDDLDKMKYITENLISLNYIDIIKIAKEDKKQYIKKI